MSGKAVGDDESVFRNGKFSLTLPITVSRPVRLVHHFLSGILKYEAVIVNVSLGLAYISYASAPVLWCLGGF